MLVFRQLRLSMEHQQRVSINTPTQSEACFCSELGLKYRDSHSQNKWDSNQLLAAASPAPLSLRSFQSLPLDLWLPYKHDSPSSYCALITTSLHDRINDQERILNTVTLEPTAILHGTIYLNTLAASACTEDGF